jgi:hypothetical protein
MFVICTRKMCRKIAILGEKTISKLDFFNYINLTSALLQLILEKMYPYRYLKSTDEKHTKYIYLSYRKHNNDETITAI